MLAVIEAPVELVEEIAELRLPAKADQRLKEFMDANTEDTLTEMERHQLEALVELSERISLMRAKALFLLGRKP